MTSSKRDQVEVVTSKERRRRWAAAEKKAIVQETYEPGMTVSLVARRHGIAPSQLFYWRRRSGNWSGSSACQWYRNFEKGWERIKNYFQYRVTSALSEGHNNVIKMLKRRAFGYRNMEYFRLKIMQVCGYLNSRYIPCPESLENPSPAQI